MSLGPSPDAAWVGRPLDMRFPLQGDAQETGGTLCLSAEVRYGDEKISESSVTAEEPGGSGARLLRVRAPVPVNEPIVSVRVQAGCEYPLTRTYTFLAGAPVQTGASASLPALGSAPRSSIAPTPPPTTRLEAPVRAGRSGAAAGPDGIPSRNGEAAPPRPAATAPARPRPPAAVRNIDPAGGAGSRAAQGAVASGAAPSKPSTQPILQLEDPAWFKAPPETLRRSDALVSQPTGSDEERKRAAAEWERLGGSAPAAGAIPPGAAAATSAEGIEDQMAQIRAELAAARKEIARLQNEVKAQAVPAAEEPDHRPYLIAGFGAVAVAAAGAWLLGRRRQRRAEAGAWWHGDPSVQAPAATETGFAGGAAHTDLGSVSANDLAYPVSMLPEDLERSSMFPDFLRQDPPATVPPHDEAGETLPHDDGAILHDAPPQAAAGAAPAALRDGPAAAASGPAPAAFEFDLPAVPAVPSPPAAHEAVAAPPAAWKDRYLDLDLDLDADAGTGAPQEPPEPVRTTPAVSAAPAAVDGGNLIDFEASGLGGYVKPTSRGPRD